MKVFLFVQLKQEVLDAQGRALSQRMVEMGYGEVRGARVGRMIELDLDIGDPKTVQERVTKMAKELLVNPAVEEYSIQLADE
jgi:phosphoribosylformylglycinamidine synthase PurS subunit